MLSLSWLPSLQHAGNDGDGGEGENGGEEGALGHYRFIDSVLETEDGAERGDGHGDDERVDADNGGIEDDRGCGNEQDDELEHSKDQQRHEQQTAEARGPYTGASCHVLGGNLRDAVADDEERSGHSDVADHGDGLGDDVGGMPGCDDDKDAEVGADHGRCDEATEQRSADVAPSDEACSPYEDRDGVWNVEDGGIEDGFGTEDRGYDGVADEADVSESEHEAMQAAFGVLAAPQAGQIGADGQQDGVGG